MPVLDLGACDGVLIHALNLQKAAARDKSGMFAWGVRRGSPCAKLFAEVQPVGRIDAGKPYLLLEKANLLVGEALRRYETEGGCPSDHAVNVIN